MATPIMQAFKNSTLKPYNVDSGLTFDDVHDMDSGQQEEVSPDELQGHMKQIFRAAGGASTSEKKIVPDDGSVDGAGEEVLQITDPSSGTSQDAVLPRKTSVSSAIISRVRRRMSTKRRTSIVDTLDGLHSDLHPEDALDEQGNLRRAHTDICAALTPIFQMAGYIILGYLFYHNMEVDADGNPWTFIDCMYFAIVTCTSVGYGDLTPKSAGSKMFTCVYALVGIGMIADTLMKVVAIIYRIQKAVTSRATVLMLKHSLKAKAKAQQAMGSSLKVASSAAVQSVSVGKGMTRSITNNAIGARRVSKLSKVGKQGRDVGMSVGKKGLEGAQAVTSAASHLGGAALDTSTRITQSIRNSKTYITLMILVPLIVYIFLGLVLGHIEGWDFVTSIYVACISLATVGYGDVSPQTQDGRLFASFYIPTGVAVTLNVIARLAIAYVGAKQNRRMDLSTLLRIDTSGDGSISELEFTIYMLKALKKVDPQALDMVREKFADISGGRENVPVAEFEELDLVLGGTRKSSTSPSGA